MMFSALLPLLYIVLVVGVLTIVVREGGRRPPQTLTQRANHPLRKLQVALNEPRKQAQRAARVEARRAAQEQEPKEGPKPERPPRSEPRRLKQI